uniref:Uncharacterized protein n=1 Tax=Arundo donax TaxID=35708 RepID=A0A0A9DXT3_ARUDO
MRAWGFFPVALGLCACLWCCVYFRRKESRLSFYW